MRKLILIALISFLFDSCKDTGFKEIDFIAYSYRQFSSANPDYENEWKLICPFYMRIDNLYNCQLIKGPTFADSTVKFFESHNDSELKEIVKAIINKSKSFNRDTDFRPPISQLRLYDGSGLKIRIIENNRSILIHFWQDEEATQPFEKLLYYAIKQYKQGIPSNMNPETNIRKQKFINLVVKSDSLLRPLPPLPPKGFNPKYVPPTIAK